MGIATTVAGVGAVAGGIKAIGGYKKKKAAKEKQKAAEKALANAQDALANVDTTNPFKDAKNAYEGLENKYADMENKFEGQENQFNQLENKFEGMENAFEDLTVNTQQAEFEAQQNQQQQANIMSQMAGAAGGSGIAALAQSMANQGALQAQKASASIGAQEAQNQKMAAKAEQDINMATAQEGSKLQMAAASEQSRLDTQQRQADMDIQKTQMSADDALQMAEAQGAMQFQTQKAEGQMWSSQMEMDKAKTQIDIAMQQSQQASAEKEAGDKQMWGGIGDMVGGIGKLSDKRLKENIIKIKYSNSGIPIYHFNYKGDSKTWSGAMAQDLIKLGREDAVVTMDNGYYGVKYNLIDVDMKEIKPSPLKQLGATPQEEVNKQKDMTEAGLDILSGAKARKNWEELQISIKDIEPDTMKIRKMKDVALREEARKRYETGDQVALPQAYTNAGFTLVKKYKEELYNALTEDDEKAKGEIKTKLAALGQNVDVIKDMISEFYDDHFETESLLSKGVSQQNISFSTQMYCENPELQVVVAEEQDIINGRTDYYGELVKAENQYAVVQDFYGNLCLINVLEGNKDMFIRDNMKATEYLTFLNETFEKAQEAMASKSAVKIDLGRINYKIDSLFGFNDGTASKAQDELVMMFCHDSEVLRDGSTFRRHLYEHPNIEILNYGGFDWEKLEMRLPLGPGDKGHWTDEISETDKLLLVDAIVNVDNPFFNINLLRTLVKEYYTYKLENAWWKGMGYPEGKLDVMRLKQNELAKARFKKEKAEAAGNGQLKFIFDGKVYPTGMTPEKVKKQEQERAEANKKANPELNQ